ncbi:MAG: 16S rRNA (cytosine(1402)-N(4))-methyltransferase [Candidatus Eremiobacter antarcticus]|nr:MAG: 16S rRNA (cytosine(1402)-N(4))-methyltransferase [Candidatus Eremiobacter sp. RRmetagenome_bin22]
MLQEAVTLLRAAATLERSPTFVDATFGGGGHSRALLDQVTSCNVIAIDADPAAIARARSMAQDFGGRFVAFQRRFGDLTSVLQEAGVERIDGVLYDLGLSSFQLADTRGFSFTGDDPLDMRLDPQSDAATASDLLQTLPFAGLERLLRDYGEERRAKAIAHAIIQRRAPLKRWTTSDLVGAVLRAQPRREQRRHQRIHPATRTFQALRMAVNDDVGQLERSLTAAAQALAPGGRIVAISFHSIEDRIVKHRFKEFQAAGLTATLTRKPMRPKAPEVAANPRSRSAKLRAAERVSDAPQAPLAPARSRRGASA